MKSPSKIALLSAFISALIFSSCKESSITTTQETQTTTIAFGSCSHEYDEDQMWEEIILERPDAYIWLGDIVYGDTHDMDLLKSKYDEQKNRASYQELIRNTKIYGTWDDHDYGSQDGGKHYSKKEGSKVQLLNFLDVSSENPVWQRPGVYHSWDIIQAKGVVKMILLDTRTFRDTIFANENGPDRYLINPTGDILGEEQWAWLDKELRQSEADINIIASSIQFIPQQQHFEKWSNFPRARERMMALISDTKPKITFFISGDRHKAEVSKMDAAELDYPLYDFTSSGLTHVTDPKNWEPNQYRMGELIIKENYGLITIDWQESGPEVTFRLKGKNRELYLEHRALL